MNRERALMNYEQAESYLYDRLNFERTPTIPYGENEFKLDRMREFLRRLGDPHLGPITIHVAGTKGKGSTCHFLSGMLQAAGYRTGCYTSPHLDHIEERFAIDQQPCTKDEFASLVEELRPVVDALDAEAIASNTVGPTFFEITTAMAMLHFRRQAVDVSILEVGLGGRLDSTNVCEPHVCVITSISFDHMRQLGNTLALIATEKAGIIKPGVPVVTGVVQSEPLEVIQQMAHERNAPLDRLGVDFDFAYHPPDSIHKHPTVDIFETCDAKQTPVATGVAIGALGTHQAANAALAWQVCNRLQAAGHLTIDLNAKRHGLEHTHCRGRIEVVSTQPTLIIDTAHNAASIEALVRVLHESFQDRPRSLILAATQGKQVDTMLLCLLPEFETVICTQYQDNPRAMPVDQLERAAQLAKSKLKLPSEIIKLATPAEAWRFAQQQTPPPAIVVATGSFFLAAEFNRCLQANDEHA